MTDLHARINHSALVFRGYNVTNLGRSRELLLHPVYGPTVLRRLREAEEISRDELHRDIALVDRLWKQAETSLDSYADAIALIVAMELAQLDLLRDFFGIDWTRARLAYGYSLGEVVALVAAGMIDVRSALRIPLAMSDDCADLGHDVTLGVLFSRGPVLDVEAVLRLCRQVTLSGQGVIGVSALLSPNSLLLLGQADTVNRFAAAMHEVFPDRVYLRKNEHRWPPLHSPLVWQRNVPNRAAVMLQTTPVLRDRPQIPVFSLVTGKINYQESTIRDILIQWVDHPQRLWDAVYATLAEDIKTVIHVGPEPNLAPATFKRLSDNVQGQLADRSMTGFGLRAAVRAMRRPWLAKLLPSSTALLRAPQVEQLILEDWLLAQPVQS